MTFRVNTLLLHLSVWLLILIPVFLFCLLVQPGSVSVQMLLTGFDDPILSSILWEVRLPRVINGLMTGGALAVSGLVLQLIVRNPLAEPYILGISSGASFGAILPLILGASLFSFQIGGAFTGAVLVMVVVYFTGLRYGRIDNGRLLLGGVMMGAFVSALIFMSFTFLGDGLRTAITWLMGNLSLGSSSVIFTLFPIILLIILLVYRYSYAYNLILTGEEVASQVGIPVDRIKKVSYLYVSALTALAVCVSGIIGFVGLVIPHILRRFYGFDHRYLIPFSFLGGGMLLMIADWIARAALFPVELPVGAITAFLGAPFFIALMRKQST
ncbi:MAG: iron ABC transporter permease [Bacteroidetes bacterium]|nr:iron ABC transporter permease [Bacteroidota bacterium]